MAGEGCEEPVEVVDVPKTFEVVVVPKTWPEIVLFQRLEFQNRALRPNIGQCYISIGQKYKRHK